MAALFLFTFASDFCVLRRTSCLELTRFWQPILRDNPTATGFAFLALPLMYSLSALGASPSPVSGAKHAHTAHLL